LVSRPSRCSSATIARSNLSMRNIMAPNSG